MAKNSSSTRTRITITQKRKEQIEAANGLCTSLAANLGLLDMKIATLEAQKAQKRRQLQAAFIRRRSAIESAAFDHDLDAQEWAYSMEEGAFLRGKPQTNLVAVPTEDMTPEEGSVETEPKSDPFGEPAVTVPQGGGSIDD